MKIPSNSSITIYRESFELVKFEKKLINKLEIKNRITNTVINAPNDNMLNLINGNIINIAAKLPHVPEANLM